MSNPRADLMRLLHCALSAVEGRRCVARFLASQTWDETLYVIAIGKAAAAMYQGAQDILGGRIIAGLVITKRGHAPTTLYSHAHLTLLEAGHPLPDEVSLVAGQTLLDFISATPRHARLLVLISGGTSSLVERPIAGISLNDLRRANEWFLGSGLTIHEMNALRIRLSCIKGGRLAAAVEGRRLVQLLISDVPDDVAAVIGSGLLLPPPRGGMPQEGLPQWLNEILARSGPLPAADSASFDTIETHIVATASQAVDAAAVAARTLGYAVTRHAEPLQGDAADQGAAIAKALMRSEAGVHLWAGETTVVLPPRPGRGGRNQHLALAAAGRLAGHDKVWLLAAGTDGSDGAGDAAGALVEGGTVARGMAAGFDADDRLRRADSGSFLQASGDLIRTGPTGTNVMDIVIGLKRD